jgi:hypothetical protein
MNKKKKKKKERLILSFYGVLLQTLELSPWEEYVISGKYICEATLAASRPWISFGAPLNYSEVLQKPGGVSVPFKYCTGMPKGQPGL